MKSILITVSVLIGSINLIVAQNKPWRGAMGFTLGTNQYNGELGNDFYRLSQINPLFGLNYEHYVSRRFNIQGRLWMGNWGYDLTDSTRFGADVFTTQLIGKVKLRNGDDPVWMPYAFGGVGLHLMSNWSLEDNDGNPFYNATNGDALNSNDFNRWIGVLPVGLGVQFKLSDRVFLNVDETFTMTGEKGWDGIVNNSMDQMLTHSIGIAFGLFGWNDTVHDGVGDKMDK